MKLEALILHSICDIWKIDAFILHGICRIFAHDICSILEPQHSILYDDLLFSVIRRPRPLPRQGRRLGPPEVWNLALGSQAKAHAPKRFQPSRRPPRQQLLQLQLLLQDCRLLGLKPPKRFQPARRPPRQQLLQLLRAPAICLSGGSRLPFARPQIQGNNSYSYSYYFKTAVCSASNPPNASNPPAGLQGNNSYSYYMPLLSVFQGVQDCRLPALKPPKPSRRPPRHLPSVFQGVQDCRLPALKPPKPPKPSRRPPRQQLLQLHALKPPKRFQPSRRPPRQQLLQLLHAPAICFSGVSRLPFARPQTPPTTSRLPFARPQTPQTLPTRPQASKATTLTATTCPCHLSFRGFKTAVCPPSNPRQQLLQLQLLLQDCRLLGLKPPKRFQPARRPPRQQLLQLLHAPAICLSGGSRLPFARPQTPQTLPQASKAPAICFSGGSRLPFARPQTPQTPQTLPQALKATTLTATCPQTPQTLPQASKATTLTATCPQTPQTLPTLPQASKATTLTATTCPCHLFFRGFKTAVCPASNPPNASNPPAGLQGNNSCGTWLSGRKQRHTPPNASNPPAGLQGNNSYSYYMPLPSVFQGVQDCRLPALTPPKPSRRPPRHLPSVFQGVQACRLAALKPPKPSRRPPRQQLLQLHALKPPKRFQPSRRPPRQQLLQLLHAPAICFSGGSRLPFARPQTPQTLPTLPQASKATTRVELGSRVASKGTRPQTLPTLPQASKATTLTATATTSRLPFARPQTPQTLPTRPQASKATTLTATTCPCHLSFRGFKTAVCPPSNPRQQLLQLQLLLQDCRLLGLKPPKRFQPARRPPRQQLLQLLHAPAICLSGGSRLPFARPQTPQTLPQASKAPAICFSGGSRLPFARPQTPQTLPQASKATTLTATCPQTPQTLPTLPQASKATTLTATTCPCHLFFRGFKTAVCPPSNPPYYFKTAVCSASNPPNASNPPAGLQGNNSYSYYMPLPSVLQGVQDCRLPALKSKATTLTATATTSRLPFARPQTPQTLPARPQASKATTLTATTCPCHLSFRGFKTAVCPPSNPPNPPAGLQGTCHLFFRGLKTAVCPPSNPPNPPNPPAGLQGNNSYSYMPSNPPNASNPPAGLQGNNSYSYYMPLPSVFQGVHAGLLAWLYVCALLPPPLKRGRRHQGVSPFISEALWKLKLLTSSTTSHDPYTNAKKPKRTK